MASTNLWLGYNKTEDSHILICAVDAQLHQRDNASTLRKSSHHFISKFKRKGKV